jgi:hypothetical protein
MATIRSNISLLARWRPYRLPLSSAVFNSAERFGVVHELTVPFCAQFFPRFEHEDDDEHEDETLVADFGVSSAERFAALRLCGESVPPANSSAGMRDFCAPF